MDWKQYFKEELEHMVNISNYGGFYMPNLETQYQAFKSRMIEEQKGETA